MIIFKKNSTVLTKFLKNVTYWLERLLMTDLHFVISYLLRIRQTKKYSYIVNKEKLWIVLVIQEGY